MCTGLLIKRFDSTDLPTAFRVPDGSFHNDGVLRGKPEENPSETMRSGGAYTLTGDKTTCMPDFSFCTFEECEDRDQTPV